MVWLKTSAAAALSFCGRSIAAAVDVLGPINSIAGHKVRRRSNVSHNVSGSVGGARLCARLVRGLFALQLHDIAHNPGPVLARYFQRPFGHRAFYLFAAQRGDELFVAVVGGLFTGSERLLEGRDALVRRADRVRGVLERRFLGSEGAGEGAGAMVNGYLMAKALFI